MKLFKIVGLFGSGLVIGGISVALWSGYLISRMTVSKEVDVAFQAAQQAEWLAELRLGDTTNAIKSMENMMDIGVETIAQWAAVHPPDEKTLKVRNNFLTNVKVYRESFPSSGDNATLVSTLLATVPSRSPQSKCKSGVCRLDDLRLAKLRMQTNSP